MKERWGFDGAYQRFPKLAPIPIRFVGLVGGLSRFRARVSHYAIITPINTMINANSQPYCLAILRTESFETWRD